MEESTTAVEIKEHNILCPSIRRDISILRGGIKAVRGPDGCRACIVAFAIFAINCIIIGFGKISGILFVDFMKVFKINRKAASTPFSIQLSIRNFTGSVVGIVGQKCGMRLVPITGGLIAAISAVSCSFATNIDWIILLWGALYGIATAFTSNISLVVSEQHGAKRQISTTSLEFSGGNIGGIFFPFILEKIIPNYGIQVTFLVMAVVILLVIPATIILEDPLWLQREVKSVCSSRSNQETLNSSPDALNFQSNGDSSLVLRSDEHRATNEVAAYNNLEKNDITSMGCSQVKEQTNGEIQDTNGVFRASGSQANDNMYGEAEHSQKINFNFLRQNGDIIYRLLSLNALQSENQNSMPMEKLEIFKEDFVKRELEEFYSSLEESLNNCTPFVSEVKKELLDYQTKVKQNREYFYREKEIINPAQKDEYLNYLLSLRSSPNDIVFNVKVSEYYYEIPKKLYILIELNDLFEKNEEEILFHFELTSRKHVHEVLQELRKLNGLFVPEVETSFIKSYESYVSISAWMHSQEQSNRIFLQKSNEQKSNEQLDKLWYHIKTAINLHTNPLFLLISLCRGVHVLSFMSFAIAVVDFGMDKGLTEMDGKYLLAAVSGGDLFGCLCLGWITDHGFIGLKNYMLATLILQGANSYVMPFIKRKGMILGSVFLYSALQGSAFVRHPILIHKYVKSHETSTGITCINIFSGLIGFIVPSYIGYFRDILGSYDGLFYSNSLICTSVGLLWVFEPLVRRCSSALRHMDYENLTSN